MLTLKPHKVVGHGTERLPQRSAVVTWLSADKIKLKWTDGRTGEGTYFSLRGYC
jgi:hypothetical protein